MAAILLGCPVLQNMGGGGGATHLVHRLNPMTPIGRVVQSAELCYSPDRFPQSTSMKTARRQSPARAPGLRTMPKLRFEVQKKKYLHRCLSSPGLIPGGIVNLLFQLHPNYVMHHPTNNVIVLGAIRAKQNER